MSEKTLKLSNVEVNKKEFNTVIMVLNILLATKMTILLDLYALFYLK